MKDSQNLVSYEKALRIIAGLPPPIRQAICHRISHQLLAEPDLLARLVMLPLDHPERFALPHHIWFTVAEMISGELFPLGQAKSLDVSALWHGDE